MNITRLSIIISHQALAVNGSQNLAFSKSIVSLFNGLHHGKGITIAVVLYSLIN